MVKRYCDKRIPPRLRNELRLEVETRGRSITIFEHLPPWRPDFGPDWSRRQIAQMRYDPETLTFTLYWADRNGRWLAYPNIGPTGDVGPLLREIEETEAAPY
jgi:hypothetical protein